MLSGVVAKPIEDMVSLFTLPMLVSPIVPHGLLFFAHLRLWSKRSAIFSKRNWHKCYTIKEKVLRLNLIVGRHNNA
jgi:hypothetical protein